MIFRLYSIFKGPFTIAIGDTRHFNAYEGGGTVIEVKKPETIKFVSVLKIYIKEIFLINDFNDESEMTF